MARLCSQVSPADYHQISISNRSHFPSAQEEYQRLGSDSVTQFDVDSHMSKGNYIADKQGNVILDLNAFRNGHPLGYNHRVVFYSREQELYSKFSVHQYDSANLSLEEQSELARHVMMPIAPKGLRHLAIGEKVGANPNENAIEAALTLAAKEHGVSKEQLSVLGFENGYYGEERLSKKASDSDISGLEDEKIGAFPKLKKPFAENEKENREEEDRCLD